MQDASSHEQAIEFKMLSGVNRTEAMKKAGKVAPKAATDSNGIHASKGAKRFVAKSTSNGSTSFHNKPLLGVAFPKKEKRKEKEGKP